MNEEDEYDGGAVSDLTYGFHSPIWMLKALMYYVPPHQAWNGISRAIDYLALNPDPEIGTAFDVMAQFAVNGDYTPTYEHDDSEHEGEHPLDPTAWREQVNAVNPLSAEEQEDLIEKFRATLGIVPETGPDDEGKEGE